MLARRIRALGAIMLGSALAAAACSSTGDAPPGASGGGSSGADSGSVGSSFDGSGGAAAVGSGSGSGGLDECAAEAHEGAQLPLDLVIMLDQSGSMDSEFNGQTLWQLVTDALNTFATSRDSVGIGVGLNFFPLNDGACQDCGSPKGSACSSSTCVNDCCATQTGVPCSNESMACPTGGLCFNGQCWTSGGVSTCEAQDYADLDVTIQALPGAAGAIATSIDAHGPAGATPTAPALQGAIDAAKAHATANPDHIVAVVLATDGVPSECAPQAPSDIASIAATGLGGSPEVLTFVVGLGDLGALNEIAAAGGTQNAFIVNPNQNASQQFLDALNAIRGTLLSCEFDIPTPERGTLDYGLVNVQFTPEGSEAQVIPQVAGIDACDSSGGWYYDAPSSPTKILMCPSTCDALKSGNAALEIVLGCETIVK